MIKKQYQEPEFAVIEIDVIDVIRTSSMSDQGDGNWDNEDTVDSDNFFQ